jgi:cell wall assembly regulator SMI1
MDINMRRSYAPLDEVELATTERDLDIKFPPEYRHFLAVWNGGRPQQDLFVYEGHGYKESNIIDWFLGIHNGENNNLRSYARVYKERIPRNLLPIAHDPGGNLICIAVSGSDLGAVYFWDHEEESDEGQPPSTENVYLIASGFDAFLANLTPHA